MNRENIQKVRDVIAALPPAQFDMRELGTKNECGTVACIAGWACEVLGTGNDRDYGTTSVATEMFGITQGQAHELFWLGSAEPGSKLWLAGPDHAVRVLDHLLATGEVDWESTRRAKKPASSGSPSAPHGNSGRDK